LTYQFLIILTQSILLCNR